MTIVLLVINKVCSGAEKRFLRIFSALSARGHSPHLIINGAIYREAAKSKEFGDVLARARVEKRLILIPSYRFGLNRLGKWIGKKRATGFLRLHPDAIVHAAIDFNLAEACARQGAARVIFEVTSPDVADLLVSPERINRLDAFVSFNAVSPSVARRLTTKLRATAGAPSIKLSEAPLPFFLPTAGYATPENFARKEKLFVYASRFIARKNPVLFAETASRVLDRVTDWRVAMFGFGPLEQEIRRILKRHLDSGRATVAHLPSIYPVLRTSSVYCSVITPDNYPSQSILEAMAMGNAIIANDAGNTSRFVQPANGLLCSLDPADLEETMVGLAKSDNLRRAMGEASVRLVQDSFSPERYVEFLQRLYAGNVEFVSSTHN